MEDSDENIWINFSAGLITIVMVALIFAATVLYTGWVTWLLWNWHAVPFTDIKLTLAQTIGATTLLGSLKGYSTKKGKSDASLTKLMVIYSMALLVGWLAHIFG